MQHMTKSLQEPTLDAEEKTLHEMAFAALPLPPRLVIMGTDSMGNERRGEILLQQFRTMPDAASRKQYMRVLGKDAAAVKPYMHKIDEIHFWEKKRVDLRAEGFSESQEAIVVNGVSVSRNVIGTHAFILNKQRDDIQVQNLESETLDEEEERSLIYDEIIEFANSYLHHAPKAN